MSCFRLFEAVLIAAGRVSAERRIGERCLDVQAQEHAHSPSHQPSAGWTISTEAV
jgi:hypothetical protein